MSAQNCGCDPDHRPHPHVCEWCQQEREAVARHFRDWTPTADNINRLPDRLRDFIHQTETRCDPAGETRVATISRDLIRAQERELETLRRVVKILSQVLKLV